MEPDAPSPPPAGEGTATVEAGGRGPARATGGALARARRGWEARVAAAVAALLAVVLTWPVALRPTELLVGHPGNDTWNHVWGHWWVGAELLAGEWPIQTPLLNHPRGGTLFYIDTSQAVMFAPLTIAAGPEVGYNATVLFGLFLSGFGAWLLARRVTGDAVSSAVALFVYGAAPHLLGQSYNGISETVCAGWLPLTLWALLHLMDRPTVARAALLGLLGGTTMLTSWYYGLLAGLAGVVMIGWRLLRQRAHVPWARFLPLAGLSGAVALGLVAPMLILFRLSLSAEDAVVTRDPEFVRASLVNHNVTDVAAFFTPSDRPSPDLKELYGEELVIIIYIGWLALLLAMYAWAGTRRARQLSPWLWLGLTFFVFSLGPYLNIGGDYRTLFGQRVPLPFLAFFEAFPLFDRISHPFRFVTGVSLAVGVSAAVGLRHLLRHLRPTPRLLTVALLCLCVLAETAVASPATLPVPHARAHIPAAYAAMRQDPQPGAVLDLPLTVPNLERAVYVWFQAAHQRPIPWGLNDPMPRGLLDNRLTATLIRLEASRAWTPSAGLPELDLVIGARTLQRQGYRYIVVHRAWYPPFKAERVERLLTALYGEPQAWPEDDLLVYTLGAEAG
ncbi:hypothetical protein L6R53_00925 [Myxococcota bacterium]|nr:hypothetical protein [Myxococcota bacterium]